MLAELISGEHLLLLGHLLLGVALVVATGIGITIPIGELMRMTIDILRGCPTWLLTIHLLILMFGAELSLVGRAGLMHMVQQVYHVWAQKHGCLLTLLVVLRLVLLSMVSAVGVIHLSHLLLRWMVHATLLTVLRLVRMIVVRVVPQRHLLMGQVGCRPK